MMSLDGYAAGPEQSEENRFGIGGMQLNGWLIPLTAFREMHGEEGGEVNAAPEPLRGLRPRKVDAVSATVLDTSMSPRSKRPPTEEAR